MSLLHAARREAIPDAVPVASVPADVMPALDILDIPAINEKVVMLGPVSLLDHIDATIGESDVILEGHREELGRDAANYEEFKAKVRTIRQEFTRLQQDYETTVLGYAQSVEELSVLRGVYTPLLAERALIPRLIGSAQQRIDRRQDAMPLLDEEIAREQVESAKRAAHLAQLGGLKGGDDDFDIHMQQLGDNVFDVALSMTEPGKYKTPKYNEKQHVLKEITELKTEIARHERRKLEVEYAVGKQEGKINDNLVNHQQIIRKINKLRSKIELFAIANRAYLDDDLSDKTMREYEAAAGISFDELDRPDETTGEGDSDVE